MMGDDEEGAEMVARRDCHAPDGEEDEEAEDELLLNDWRALSRRGWLVVVDSRIAAAVLIVLVAAAW